MIQYSPYSFVQSNFGMNRELVQTVAQKISNLISSRKNLEPENQSNDTSKDQGKKFDRKETILELFAGNGNFTLSLLKRSFNVVAVEGERSLCQLMKKNAANNKSTEKESPKYGDLFVVNKDVLEYLKSPLIPNYNCILLDPPRTGLGRCSKYLVPSLSKFIVYVSCDAESLSQDLKVIVANGFSIKEQILLDMFPQTSHFETVTILESKDTLKA